MNNWGPCTQTHHYGSLRVGRLSHMSLKTCQNGSVKFHAFKCSVLGDCDCRAVTAGCFWGALSFCCTVIASNGWGPCTVMWHQRCQAVFAERQCCWCDPVLVQSNYAVLKFECFFCHVYCTLKSSSENHAVRVFKTISSVSLYFSNIISTNQVLCDTAGINMYYLCLIFLDINVSIIL